MPKSKGRAPSHSDSHQNFSRSKAYQETHSPPLILGKFASPKVFIVFCRYPHLPLHMTNCCSGFKIQITCHFVKTSLINKHLFHCSLLFAVTCTLYDLDYHYCFYYRQLLLPLLLRIIIILSSDAELAALHLAAYVILTTPHRT